MRMSDWSADVCSSDLTLPDRSVAVAQRLGSFRVERGIGADVVEELGQRLLEADLILDLLHALLDPGDFAQAKLVNLVRRHLGGRLPLHQIRSEEHTSELQSLMRISYAVFCLKKKNPRILRHFSICHKQVDPRHIIYKLTLLMTHLLALGPQARTLS